MLNFFFLIPLRSTRTESLIDKKEQKKIKIKQNHRLDVFKTNEKKTNKQKY